MTLKILDLKRIQYVKLDSGELADSFTVHELRKRMRKEGHVEVGPDDGKQVLLERLYDFREAQELAARKHPANQGSAIVDAAKARAGA